MIVKKYGDPDHNCKHDFMRLGFLPSFLELDLDIMLVMRITSTHSWDNLVKKVTSILNLGLQKVAIARHKMPEYEKTFKKCNGMSAMRLFAETRRPAPEFEV
jgi:hypothetical protein